MQAALERALADLAFGKGFDPDDAEAVERWLERNSVSAPDRIAIRQAGAHGLSVYRSLIRGNLKEAIGLQAERTVARLGPLFDEYFDEFLERRGPRTHYVRDVTGELLDFCEPLWRQDARVPSFMIELARHENLQIEIASMRGGRPTSVPELALDAPVCFIDAARVVRYAHAVHELSDDPEDRTEPTARPTTLFVYRSPEHEVRYLELSSLAAGILEALLGPGTTLGDAVVGACKAENVRLDEKVIEGTAKVLADLAARGALLGAAPSTARSDI